MEIIESYNALEQATQPGKAEKFTRMDYVLLQSALDTYQNVIKMNEALQTSLNEYIVKLEAAEKRLKAPDTCVD